MLATTDSFPSPSRSAEEAVHPDKNTAPRKKQQRKKIRIKKLFFRFIIAFREPLEGKYTALERLTLIIPRYFASGNQNRKRIFEQENLFQGRNKQYY
ncbi:MAG: hypothetical protein IJP07_02575 [Firmicutes bacterium]|nr:hypothetical protein [Bacillota bacterium]